MSSNTIINEKIPYFTFEKLIPQTYDIYPNYDY
jgi:hypothetical protein